MKDNLEQIKECRNVEGELSYLANQAIGAIKTEAGQSQSYCRLCQRWQWPGKLCKKAIVCDSDSQTNDTAWTG